MWAPISSSRRRSLSVFHNLFYICGLCACRLARRPANSPLILRGVHRLSQSLPTLALGLGFHLRRLDLARYNWQAHQHFSYCPSHPLYYSAGQARHEGRDNRYRRAWHPRHQAFKAAGEVGQVFHHRDLEAEHRIQDSVWLWIVQAIVSSAGRSGKGSK